MIVRFFDRAQSSVRGTRVAKCACVHRSLLTLSLLVACGREPAPEASTAPLTVPSTPTRAPGETLGSLDEGRAIHVRVLPAPVDADPDRVVTLRVDGFPELDGVEALDAAFVGDGVAVVTTDHRLRWYAQPGAAPVELDERVEPPLSSEGTRLAYARGEMPFYAIVRLDVTVGTPEAITDEARSCWSPAIAADGSLAYVCTQADATNQGRPTLFVRDGQATGAQGERALPTERFPTSPVAPRFDGARLAFGDEAGAVVVDARTGALLAVDEEAGAVFEVNGGLVVTGVDGTLRALDVAEVSR